MKKKMYGILTFTYTKYSPRKLTISRQHIPVGDSKIDEYTHKCVELFTLTRNYFSWWKDGFLTFSEISRQRNVVGIYATTADTTCYQTMTAVRQAPAKAVSDTLIGAQL